MDLLLITARLKKRGEESSEFAIRSRAGRRCLISPVPFNYTFDFTLSSVMTCTLVAQLSPTICITDVELLCT